MNNINNIPINRIKIIINSKFDDLFEHSKKFCEKLPFEIICVSGKDGTHGLEYLQYVSKNIDCDWIISVDEDCFIINSDAVIDLLKYQIDNNIGFSGMPDGGVISHRFQNPISPNPFFSIIKMKDLKESCDFLNYDCKYSSDLKCFIPNHLIKQNMPYEEKFNRTIAPGYKAYSTNISGDFNFESYYQIFFSMLRNCVNPLYLDAYDSNLDDFTSVIKNHDGVDIAYHTWYARDWIHTEHRNRMLKVIDYCNKIKK